MFKQSFKSLKERNSSIERLFKQKIQIFIKQQHVKSYFVNVNDDAASINGMSYPSSSDDRPSKTNGSLSFCA